MPSNWNHLCPYCLTVTKQNIKCGTCGQETMRISKQARVPKKGASKREWKELFDTFPYILKNAPRTRALVDLGFQK